MIQSLFPPHIAQIYTVHVRLKTTLNPTAILVVAWTIAMRKNEVRTRLTLSRMMNVESEAHYQN